MDLQILPTAGTNFYAGSQLFDWIKHDADAAFAAHEARLRALRTAEEARVYQRERRELFLQSLGGLPEERTPMEPVTTGALQRDGYRIERVVFQSLPGFHVTNLLYLPDRLREEKNPAILFVCGHGSPAKAYVTYQRVCQQLARAGFVVLAMDPVGQGERQQYFVPGQGYGRLSFGVPEHTHYGLQCTLAGASVARYFVWDMMRAVDYLAGLPYVDPARIGATGSSGGGTQTAYLMLADERLAAAAPCTYLNDRRLYLHSGQGHDAEQNLFASIRDGVGYDDFLIGFAPKPALLGAARFDFFHFKGARRCHDSARRVYALYGTEEHCQLAVAETEHAYSATLRAAATNFFLRHLAGLPEQAGYTDDELPLEPPEATTCCASGNVTAEFPGERTVYALNRDYLQKRQQRTAPTPERVAAVLGIADRLPLRAESTCRIETSTPEDAGFYEFNGIIRKRVEFFAEDDIFLTGLYFQERCTQGTRPRLWLLLPEDGLADGRAANARVLDLIRAGNAVFVCDVRGTGAGASHPINPYPRLERYGTEFVLACDLMMLGRSLPGLRAFDVLRAIDCLAEMGGDVNAEAIWVHGCGAGALHALFAAVLEPRIAGGVLEGMLPSFAALVETELYHLPCPERLAVHGILRHFDIPDLLQAVAPRQFELRNPLHIGNANPVRP